MLHAVCLNRSWADIIILDDNFKSIVNAVLWGRSVYENIRKFLQFQLTVNVVALVLTLIASLAQREALPLTAIQLCPFSVGCGECVFGGAADLLLH